MKAILASRAPIGALEDSWIFKWRFVCAEVLAR